MLVAMLTRGGTYVSLMDGDGQEHVVPVLPGLGEQEATELAMSKLEAWAQEGRAVFKPPLRPKGITDDA